MTTYTFGIVVLTKLIFSATNTKSMMLVIQSFYLALNEIDPDSYFFMRLSRSKKKNVEFEEQEKIK